MKKNYGKILLPLVGAVAIASAVTTSFAAFVLIQAASETASGNIKVATLSDTSLVLTIEDLNPDTISFGPRADDHEGRVRTEANSEIESLSTTLQGTVSNGSAVHDLNIKLGFSEASYALFTSSEKYVALPSIFPNGIETSSSTIKVGDKDEDMHLSVDAFDLLSSDDINHTVSFDNDVISFTFSLSFLWGEKFNGLNPGDYYDIDPEGQTTNIEIVKQQMSAFHALSESEDLLFYLVVEATT